MTDTQDMPETIWHNTGPTLKNRYLVSYPGSTEYQRKDIADERVRVEREMADDLAEYLERLRKYKIRAAYEVIIGADQALNRYREHRKGDKSSG
jgi:hypothetical protein